MRGSFRIRWGVPALAVALTGVGCGKAPTPPRPEPPAPSPRFARVTDAAGIRFHHTDGSSGRRYFPEVMGGGCAFVDLTGDGRADIYLVNGARLPGTPPGPPDRDRFFRNEGGGKFTDATDAAGLGDPGYGIGCGAGDVDNDGDLDLYVTNLGRNTLYRNNGNGTFTDITAAAGVGAGGFSTGSAFADYDGDGFLDLYVCRYVVWSAEKDVPCTAHDGGREIRVYCRPSVYEPQADLLYHNNGDGTFTEVSRAAGMAVKPGRGLGCVWTDIDADGDPDLFVANDMSENFLFVNDGHGKFHEDALGRGVALGENGHSQASMGVAAVDYDGDGQMDLACTNFSGEYLALYRNMGGGRFEDVSARTGLVSATGPYVGFGLVFPDLDLDGDRDLFVVNGHVTQAAEYFYPGVTFEQPSLCLLNSGDGRFLPDAAAGSEVSRPRVSRGLAAADYDGDGDLDLLVANWRGEPDLLRNDSPHPGAWLRLRLQGKAGNRAAIGARVEVESGGKVQVQAVQSGGSYCSQGELPLTFGLGAAEQADQVRVRWPGGKVDTWKNLPARQEHKILQR